MKIKIPITPAMREFNEQVEHADFMLDYQFDQESADTLLMRLRQAKCYPASASALEKAMAGIAVKKSEPLSTNPWGGGLLHERYETKWNKPQ